MTTRNAATPILVSGKAVAGCHQYGINSQASLRRQLVYSMLVDYSYLYMERFSILSILCGIIYLAGMLARPPVVHSQVSF